MAKRQGRNSRRTKPESKSRRIQDRGRGSPVAPEDVPRVLVGMGCRSWEADWKVFTESHGTWWDRVRETGPVYQLPAAVINALTASSPASRVKRVVRPLISPADAAAERAFLNLCEIWGVKTIGVWPHGERIEYEIWGAEGCEIVLSEQHKDLVQRWIDAGHVTADLQGSVDEQRAAEEANLHQRLGYAGTLVFHEQFRRELQTLRNEATRLGLQENALPTIGFLRRNSGHQDTLANAQRFPRNLQAFFEAMGQFLSKWHLVRIVTWDLPLPQTRLAGAGAGLITHLLGPDAPVDFVPAYLDLPVRTDLRGELRERQSREGKEAEIGLELPVTGSSAWGGSPSGDERAFRMWLAELTVCRRYGRLRGLAGRLVAAFRTVFGRPVTEDHVKRLRRGYLPIMRQESS